MNEWTDWLAETGYGIDYHSLADPPCLAIELAEGFEALFAECAPYVYPIPHDDDATEYGAECACGWRVDGVSRETAQREADEHGGCDE